MPHKNWATIKSIEFEIKEEYPRDSFRLGSLPGVTIWALGIWANRAIFGQKRFWAGIWSAHRLKIGWATLDKSGIWAFSGQLGTIGQLGKCPPGKITNVGVFLPSYWSFSSQAEKKRRFCKGVWSGPSWLAVYPWPPDPFYPSFFQPHFWTPFSRRLCKSVWSGPLWLAVYSWQPDRSFTKLFFSTPF